MRKRRLKEVELENIRRMKKKREVTLFSNTMQFPLEMKGVVEQGFKTLETKCLG